MLERCLCQNGMQCHITVFREPDRRRSAGLNIRLDDFTTLKMNLSIRQPIAGSRRYSVGILQFDGVLPVEIVADKFSVLSGRHLFRRIKDVADLYLLSQSIAFRTDEITEILDRKERNIGDFHELLTQQIVLEHAWATLNRMKVKPDFITVYDRILKLIQPFLANNNREDSLIWQPEAGEWRINA